MSRAWPKYRAPFATMDITILRIAPTSNLSPLPINVIPVFPDTE